MPITQIDHYLVTANSTFICVDKSNVVLFLAFHQMIHLLQVFYNHIVTVTNTKSPAYPKATPVFCRGWPLGVGQLVKDEALIPLPGHTGN